MYMYGYVYVYMQMCVYIHRYTAPPIHYHLRWMRAHTCMQCAFEENHITVAMIGSECT